MFATLKSSEARTRAATTTTTAATNANIRVFFLLVLPKASSSSRAEKRSHVRCCYFVLLPLLLLITVCGSLARCLAGEGYKTGFNEGSSTPASISPRTSMTGWLDPPRSKFHGPSAYLRDSILLHSTRTIQGISITPPRFHKLTTHFFHINHMPIRSTAFI